MESRFKINAYEKNQIKLYSVLGEADSRTVIFDIVEKSGVVSAVSNAQVVDLMLDLTGYAAALNIIGTDITVSGTVTAAQSGTVSFTLTEDFCKAAGKYQCEIVLTKSSERLCMIGIELTVDYPVKESFDIEITAGFADGVNLTLYSDDGSIYSLQSGEALIFKAKRNVDDTQAALSMRATTADQSGSGYDIVFSPADTVNLKGTYHYGVALQKSDGLHPVIEDAKLTVRRTVI